MVFNGSQLAKMKKKKSRFLKCPRHKIHRVEVVDPSNFHYALKKYDFCEYVKFWVISWKFDIWFITA